MKKSYYLNPRFIIITLLWAAFASVSYSSVEFQFSTGATMRVSRGGTEGAVQLQNGKILIVGGNDGSGGALSSAELYDPSTSSFVTVAGAMTTSRKCPLIAALLDGRALIVGGYQGANAASPIATAEIYDPNTNTFSRVASPPDARYAGSIVTLKDGRVLVAANWGANWTSRNWALIYSPASNTWVTAPMRVARCSSASTLLSDGRVMIAGGYVTTSSGSIISAIEIFNPITNTFADGGNMTVSRANASTILLPNNKVLVCGGASTNGGTLGNVEIYDPVAISSGATIPLQSSHQGTRLALTDDGRVLITAPEAPKAVLFDPATSAFVTLSSQPAYNRHDGFSFVLPSRQIILLGGDILASGASATTAEIFYRPNLLPVPNAGPDQTVYTGVASTAIVTLDASASTDPEGGALTYQWSGAFGAASGVSPSVTLPLGINDITLTVTDDAAQSATATVFVAVVQGVDGATYAQLQSQMQTLTEQNTALSAQNQMLTQTIDALKAAIQSISQGFDQIKAHANSIISICDEKKQTADTVISGN